MQIFLWIISISVIGSAMYALFRRKPLVVPPKDEAVKAILGKEVLFYQRISPPDKLSFEARVKQFLHHVRITGIKTIVEDKDRILVAAAAIIPIFHFPGWEYRNLHEVLLYPGSFNEEFEMGEAEKPVLGMVGSGALQNIMVLSREDLRTGFSDKTDFRNTAIHEFVHLVDKSDGAMDGIPEVLIPYQNSIPWLKRIHHEIEQIKEGNSDINIYGATNEAEFLSVAAEYFFEQPEKMKENHPELFEMLQQAFGSPNAG